METIKKHVGTVFDLVMRIPAVFLVDSWYMRARTQHQTKIFSSENLNALLVSHAVILTALLIIFLPTRNIRLVYCHMFALVLLLTSYILNEHYIDVESERCFERPRCATNENVFFHVTTFTAHSVFSTVICILLPNAGYYRFIGLINLLPVLARVLNIPVVPLDIIFRWSEFFFIISTKLYLINKWEEFRCSIIFMINLTLDSINTISPLKVVLVLYEHAFSAPKFAVYFVVKVALKAFDLYLANEHSSNPIHFILQSTSYICISPLNVLATAIVVSYLAKGTLFGISYIIKAEPANTPMNTGWAQGAMMFVLGIQTGLMDLTTELRPRGLLVILLVIFSSLLQAILEITEPVVLSLSASRSIRGIRHAKALVVCMMLFVMPLYLATRVGNLFRMDFWVLMVIGTCILTSVRVLGTLAIHGIFVYDGLLDDSMTDLDDAIYYARSVVKVLEFLVAVFVVAVGIYDNSQGRWNMANISILIVHAYYNVYQRMMAGWKSFLLRHGASSKIMSFPQASREKIMEYNDVCPICYQTLLEHGETCITPCSHLFHRNCLRKWLYSQSKCPMCHKNITGSENEPEQQPVDVIQALGQQDI